MYRKVLIPLDGSKEAEGVFSHVRQELAPDGEVILLQVIRPRESKVWHLAYCTGVIPKLGGDPRRWRCEIAEDDSVAEGIVRIASREGVDLIAMYTHDRKGLAALMKKSIAKEVERRAPVSAERRAPIDVKVFKPRELRGVS